MSLFLSSSLRYGCTRCVRYGHVGAGQIPTHITRGLTNYYIEKCKASLASSQYRSHGGKWNCVRHRAVMLSSNKTVVPWIIVVSVFGDTETPKTVDGEVGLAADFNGKSSTFQCLHRPVHLVRL